MGNGKSNYKSSVFTKTLFTIIIFNVAESEHHELFSCSYLDIQVSFEFLEANFLGIFLQRLGFVHDSGELDFQGDGVAHVGVNFL